MTKILARSAEDGGIQQKFNSDERKCLMRQFSVFAVYVVKSASVH